MITFLAAAVLTPLANGTITPIHDLYANAPEHRLDGWHIRGTIYLSKDWDGSWEGAPPVVYYSSNVDAPEDWPFLTWQPMTARFFHPSSSPANQMAFEAISDTTLSPFGMIAITYHGVANDPPKVAETTFAITNYPTTTYVIHEPIRGRDSQRRPTNSIIPLDFMRPWNPEMTTGTALHKIDEFHAYKQWGANTWLYGWPSGTGGNPYALGSSGWTLIPEDGRFTKGDGEPRRATLKHGKGLDNYSYVMIYDWDYTREPASSQNYHYTKECGGVIRQVDPSQ
jgi:hypothetical protein